MTAAVAELTELVGAVPDPELPMVTIADLGILRDVIVSDGRVLVTITPTYSGCPALAEIRHDIRRRLDRAGYPNTEVRSALAPAWTSDWITQIGRRKLAAAGIAPPSPAPQQAGPRPLQLGTTRRVVSCPRCGSAETTERSRFGSTSCQALFRCEACGEPFDYVKEI